LLRLGEVLGSRVGLVRVETLLSVAGILGDVIESFVDELLLFLLLLVLEVLRVIFIVILDVPQRRLRLYHHLVPIWQKELLVSVEAIVLVLVAGVVSLFVRIIGLAPSW